MPKTTTLKNNKKRPQTRPKSNKVEPSMAKEYEAAYKLEYEKLSKEDRERVDKVKNNTEIQDRFVNEFIQRVIRLAEGEKA